MLQHALGNNGPMVSAIGFGCASLSSAYGPSDDKDSVIPSHANQPSTSGGKVIEGTRTDQFIKATKAKVHLPLSGRTMAFNNKGECVDGC